MTSTLDLKNAANWSQDKLDSREAYPCGQFRIDHKLYGKVPPFNSSFNVDSTLWTRDLLTYLLMLGVLDFAWTVIFIILYANFIVVFAEAHKHIYLYLLNTGFNCCLYLSLQ